MIENKKQTARVAQNMTVEKSGIPQSRDSKKSKSVNILQGILPLKMTCRKTVY